MSTTTLNPTEAAPAAAPAPAAEAAPWRARLQTGVRVGLLLAMIWGLAGFVWGSLDSWTHYRTRQELQAMLREFEPRLAALLQEPFAPLRQMQDNSVFAEALVMPLGVAGPAAERLLNQYALQLNEPDLILYDANTGRIRVPTGTTAPGAEVLKRLNSLPLTEYKIVASGSRLGLLYLAVRMPLPPTKEIYLVRTLGLRQLAAAWQAMQPPKGKRLTLSFPHIEGSAATWLQDEPTRLTLGELKVEEDHATRRVGELPELTLHASLEDTHARAVPLFVTILILMWALGSTLAVLWPYLEGPRRAIWEKLGAPVQQRLGPVLQPLGAFAASMPISGLLSSASTLLQPLLTGNLLGRKARAWSPETGGEEGGLLDGPGAYSASDFRPVDGNGLSVSSSVRSARNAANRPRATEATPPKSLEEMTEQERAVHDEQLRSRVVTCMQHNQIELIYQPIYNTTSGNVEFNEILARLADHDGTIMPGQFLPILAKLGQISALDAMVFEKVVAQHFAQGKVPQVKLSLNISGTSLEDLSYLRDVAQRGSAVLKHLMFEVRSNEVVRDPNALQLLRGLQRQGARVAVDYFGGGRAMIEASKALGIDFIKLDAMRFTSTRPLKREFVEVCVIAQDIGLPMIVEKVEDQLNEAFARRSGAQLLQGYGMGKPAPALVTLPRGAKL